MSAGFAAADRRVEEGEALEQCNGAWLALSGVLVILKWLVV